jgi:glycosyltransferase 2 family protein
MRKSQKVLQCLLATVVIAAVVYFFYNQFKRNWDAMRAYHVAINFRYIVASIFVMMIGFLMETYIWQICMNHYLTKKLAFWESITFVNISNLFKYIPGRFWAYTVQISLMSKKNIAKSLVLYVNFVCLLCVTMVSTIYGLYYLLFYLKVFPMLISILLFGLLILVDLAFIMWNTRVINWLIIIINTFFKREIQPINIEKWLILYIQFLYLIAWIPPGISAYFLAKGIGLDVAFTDVFAFVSSMSVSWIIGYIAIFTPGGLGVREGIMFLMLKQFSNVNTALILPIAMRLIYIFMELLLGIVGILVGMKYGYFPKQWKGRQKL